jgi:hypothetical protein
MALFSGSRRLGMTMLAVAWLALLLPLSARAFAEPIYINVLVEDPSQVIKGSVEETIGNTWLPGPLKRLATFSASTLASFVATPSFVAKRMYEKMPSKMTDKMKGNGLTVKVEPVFQEGT